MASISIPVMSEAALASAAADASATVAAGVAGGALTAATTAGSIFTFGNMAAAAGALAAGVSAYGQHQAGVAQSNMDKQKARVEALSETQKQINMRQNMLRALASQNAGTLGATGTGRGTGFGANAQRQIDQAQNDLAVSKANSSAQVSLLDQAGSNARGTGNLNAAGSLASGASSFMNGIG